MNEYHCGSGGREYWEPSTVFRPAEGQPRVGKLVFYASWTPTAPARAKGNGWFIRRGYRGIRTPLVADGCIIQHCQVQDCLCVSEYWDRTWQLIPDRAAGAWVTWTAHPVPGSARFYPFSADNPCGYPWWGPWICRTPEVRRRFDPSSGKRISPGLLPTPGTIVVYTIW